MSEPDVPLIDIGEWRSGDEDQRRALAQRLDRAMQDSGFFLVGNHGISGELMAQIREAARAFFTLPDELKQPCATSVGGRGWLATGREANAFYGESADGEKPDLKESLTLGRDAADLSGDVDPAMIEAWFQPNVWPSEVPELRELGTSWVRQVRALYLGLLELCAAALGLPHNHFADHARNSPHTFNINRYPARRVTGAPAEGQFRVGPHTDWGILTILDRQAGYGGLQIQTLDGDWADAPAVQLESGSAFTVNICDLLARWTGDRWRSTRHRVLPPPEQAPDEELISLIVFLEAEMDTVIEPLPPPIGGGAAYPPVTAGDYLLERIAAASFD